MQVGRAALLQASQPCWARDTLPRLRHLRCQACQQPGEVLIRSLSEASKQSGRQARNVATVFAPSEDEEQWRALDQKVNTYPAVRSFKAIGSGGSEFRDNMVKAVEGIVGPLQAPVQERASSGGRFTSVTVRALVKAPEEVVAIFSAMKAGDSRLRYFL